MAEQPSRKRRIVRWVALAFLAIPAIFVSYIASLCLILYLNAAGILTVNRPVQTAVEVYVTPLRYYCRFELPGCNEIEGCLNYARDAGVQRRRATIERDEQLGSKD